MKRDSRPAAEIIQEAVNIANQSDVIIAALGESAEMSGESSSRSDIQIPEAQKELLKALLKTGKTGSVGFIYRKTISIKMGKRECTCNFKCVVWWQRSRLCYC